MNDFNLGGFTDVLGDEIGDSQESQPLSLSLENSLDHHVVNKPETSVITCNSEAQVPRPAKGTGQYGQFRSVEEVDEKYRSVFSYPFFNLVQSSVIEDALYSDKSMVVCAPTGSGKTVVFEMAIVQLLMEIEDKHYTDDFKIIYMAPVKALCTERLSEWYPKFTRLGLLCIEVTGDTDVDFSQLKPYRIIITTPEKWDMVTRRWREHRQLVEVIKLFLIDEVHILNDETRGPVLEAVVSRMKTIESSAQSAHRIEQLQKQYQTNITQSSATTLKILSSKQSAPKIRFVAVSATVGNPQDVAAWLGTTDKPAIYYTFGDESRPVKLKRVVEGYPCPEGTSIFKFDIILNYKLWPVIQKYHNGKPTLIFCNTRKSVALTAETLSRELTVTFSPEQKAKLTALASTIKNKKLQALVLSGVGCHHAGLLFEERTNIEQAFRSRDLPILITTTTLAMGVNLPAHLVIIKNTQQYVNGAYQEYSISTILQMVGRAGRPQFDTEATAVIMTRACDKLRYQSLVGGSEPLQSYLHKRLAENLNSEAALGTVNDVAQCVQWLRSTFLCVRAARDPKRYLGLLIAAPQQQISKKIEELCVKAMNGLATAGLITMDEASCIESTEAGRLMSIYYLDLETMKHIMKINGTETLERLLWIVCESHELADMHLRVDERRCLNTLNRNNQAATIRFPMKGKISTRQMKLNCIIQAILGCLSIPEPSLNQEAMKIMRIADRVCKCLIAYVSRPALVAQQPKYYTAVLNSLILAKCVAANLWENSPFVSKQLKGIGPTFSTLLATAGKVNFMLLEESHPRDLERIMNRGPPAGNVLRKQISLLPKYQLTMTPVDEKTVSIQLVLLNQNYLSENIEQLTAGDGHKSYLVVGNTDNDLLLFTSFKDKDLIRVYDGTITHQVTRKHSFEHKIFAHCISSTFVGIDAQCVYVFKDLEIEYPLHLSMNVDLVRKPANKQTTITDTFKERKRKSASENDVTQSKEKKKRDNALFEKFKYLKKSFGKTTKELKEDLDKSAAMSNMILGELTNLDKPVRCIETENNITESTHDNSQVAPITNSDINNSSIQKVNTETIDSDAAEFMDDDKINSILNKIETEISKANYSSDLPHVKLNATKVVQSMQSTISTSSCSKHAPQMNTNLGFESSKSFNNTKKRLKKNTKSNYNFIDLLEKNMNLSDEEDKPVSNKNSELPNTIKCQIEKYLQNINNVSKIPNRSITEVLQVDDRREKPEKKQKENTDDSQIAKGITVNESNKHNEKVNALPGLNYTSKRNDINNYYEVEELIKQVLESEDHDTNTVDTEVINSKNYTVDIVDNAFPIQNAHQNESPSKYVCDDGPKNTEIGLKEKALIICNEANSLVSARNQDVSPQFNTNYQSLDDMTAKPSIIDCPFTSTTASTESQRLTYPEKPEAQRQIICEDNTIHSNSDVFPKPNYPRLTSSINAKPVSTSQINCNNYANENNHNANVRKYSYSTTKIDVATKNTPDHIVRVIRQTKMDLNITEIVSRQHKDKDIDVDKPAKQNLYLENSCSGFQMPQTLPSTSLPSSAQYEGHNNYIATYDISNAIGQSDKDSQILDISEKHPFEIRELPKITLTPEFQSVQSEQIKETCDHNTKVISNVDNHIENDKPSMEHPQKESNRLESILQKYSKILRKNNNTISASQTLTLSKSEDQNLDNTPSVKPKRPFKISDIHNLNTSLPMSLISETSKPENIIEQNSGIAYEKVQQDDINHQHIVQNKEMNSQQGEQTEATILVLSKTRDTWKEFNDNCDSKLIRVEEDIAATLDENLLECELPPISIEDLNSGQDEINFNIDQLMFNPKTLLQCFSDDVDQIDIVPPPPEFCDETVSNTSNIEHSVLMDCYEPTMQWGDSYEKDITNEETRFPDTSRVELTSNKEIESWTLSQDDEKYENRASSAMFNPIQSFTITHKNSGQRSNPFQNVSAMRQSRLGQFKFCRKRKYLPKI